MGPPQGQVGPRPHLCQFYPGQVGARLLHLYLVASEQDLVALADARHVFLDGGELERVFESRQSHILDHWAAEKVDQQAAKVKNT